MKTGPVMRNKSHLQLTLSILFMAALCLEATIIEKSTFCPSQKLNWAEARQHCQKFHIDMITWNGRNARSLALWLKEIEIDTIWIGLHRDPKNDSAWRWIDPKTGEGSTGSDISNSTNWADGQQSGHCAMSHVSRWSKRKKWESVRCSEEHQVYCSVGDTIEYHSATLSWYDASHFCQHRSSDLATITQNNEADLDEDGWIGLYRVAADTWSWIGDVPSQYRDWASKQPYIADCASFDVKTKKWHSNSCAEEFRFACSADNLVVVNENKTWEDAREHCLQMNTPCDEPETSCKYQHDLLSLSYSYEYTYVRDRIYRATTDEVWTGLRFLAGEWWWVNGKVLQDREKLPDCPPQGKHCGTLSKHNTSKWIMRDCSERRNFVCYKYKAYLKD